MNYEKINPNHIFKGINRISFVAIKTLLSTYISVVFRG